MGNIIPYDADGNVIKRLTQWDTDVYVYVTDDSFTSTSELEFSTRKSKLAFTMDTTYSSGTLSAKIPNIILAKGEQILAYIRNDGMTIGGFVIPVTPRNKPSDLVYYGDDEYLSLRVIRDKIDSIDEDYETAISEFLTEYMTENPVEVSDALMAATLATYLEANPIEDGVGIDSITTSKEDGVTTVTITLTSGDTYSFEISDGTDGADGADGTNGADGANGTDGIGIDTVTAVKEDGVTTVTITLTDGNAYSFDVSDGEDGADGTDGATGADGKSAYEYAAEGGYTGTEEEFIAALASIAELLSAEEVEW